MAVTDVRPFLDLVPAVRESPDRAVWMTYDQGADTLYVHFKKPNLATDSELREDDVIVRYHRDEVIGFTVLHASER